MNRIRFFAERSATEINKHIAIRYGQDLPIYLVVEHPKSGGTWLSHMIADYLKLPHPVHTTTPVGFACVLHAFWSYHPKLRNVCWLYRDGRDVMSSLFFDRARVIRHTTHYARHKLAKIYEKLLGSNYSLHDVVKLMPRFIEFEFEHPGRGVRKAWPDYVMGWWHKPHTVYVSYEQLLEDCAGTLGQLLQEMTGEPIDDWQLQTTVEKFSFERMTGRKSGTLDVTHHARKGIAGDWRNTFSREAAEVFNAYAGDALVELGYEKDKNWIDRYEYPTP